MGKKNKEHRKKVAERNLRLGIGNPLARKAIAVASRGRVLVELSRASTDDQVDALSRTAASDKPGKVRDAIKKKAPGEMDKAIKKFQQEGKPVTVDSLCAEIHATPSFVRLCKQVGLDTAWFEELATKRMAAHGITAG